MILKYVTPDLIQSLLLVALLFIETFLMIIAFSHSPSLFCTDKKVSKKPLETAARSVATDCLRYTLSASKNS